MYISNDNSLFVPPSDRYLEAVAQTMRDFRALQDESEVDAEDIKIAVRYAKKPDRVLFVYNHKGSQSVRDANARQDEKETKKKSSQNEDPEAEYSPEGDSDLNEIESMKDLNENMKTVEISELSEDFEKLYSYLNKMA